MANRGPAYGLSREVQQKIDRQYDPELEQILTQWIVTQCEGAGVQQPGPGKDNFQQWLKDGTVSSRNPEQWGWRGPPGVIQSNPVPEAGSVLSKLPQTTHHLNSLHNYC